MHASSRRSPSRVQGRRGSFRTCDALVAARGQRPTSAIGRPATPVNPNERLNLGAAQARPSFRRFGPHRALFHLARGLAQWATLASPCRPCSTRSVSFPLAQPLTPTTPPKQQTGAATPHRCLRLDRPSSLFGAANVEELNHLWSAGSICHSITRVMRRSTGLTNQMVNRLTVRALLYADACGD